MKRLVLMISLTAISIVNIANAQAVENIQLKEQKYKKNTIGTHAAFGSGWYGPVGLCGAPSYKTKYYYSIGLDYSRMLTNRLDLCSGLEYTYNDMTETPAFTGITSPTWSADLKIITVPVQVKYHVSKLFYFNGGAFFNVFAKESSEVWALLDYWNPTGKIQKNHVGILLGFGLGFGFEHEFNSGIVLSLNPYTRFNGIGRAVSLRSERLEYYKYLQGGVSLGVGYKF